MSIEKNSPKWKIIDIHNAIRKYDSYGRHLVVPTYQRGRCWKKTKEISLIDSLKKGFPIGSLLFYKHEKEDVYTIVDGLQRCNTIKKYMEKPQSMFEKTDVPSSLTERIVKTLNIDDEDRIRDAVTKTVHNLDFSDIQYSVFAEELLDILLGNYENEKLVVQIVKPFLKQLRKEYEDICDFEIPVIVYTGKAENLNEIFTRINKDVVKLNDFEIYASAWPLARYTIEKKEIVNNVLARYDAFSKADYEVEDYELIRNKIFKESQLTLFEFMFGFSKYICESFDCLAFVDIKATTDDTAINEKVNRIGFGLINVCLNGRNSSDIGKLYLKLQNLNLDLLADSIVECIKYVEKCIKHISSFKGNSREKMAPLHSQYQIMVLIASVFELKYNYIVNEVDGVLVGSIEPNPLWDEHRVKLDKTLVQHYVYDIISGLWGNGGSKRMYNSNNSTLLLSEVPYSLFNEELDHFFRISKERTGENSAKNVKAPESAEKVILNCIYTNIFTASQQLSKDYFDIEHIATKEKMAKLIKIVGIDSLPISCIGNLCYLPEFVNRSKGENTFYQDDKYLSYVPLEDVEKYYSFTTQSDLDWIDISYTKGQAKTLKKSYLDFLDHRFAIQKEKVLATLKIKKEIEKENSIVPELPPYEDGSVAAYVRNAMTMLSISDYYFFPEQIEFLKGKAFGSYLPFLSEEGEEREESRYDKHPLVLNGKRYYMSQQLTKSAKSIEKFKEWYEKL